MRPAMAKQRADLTRFAQRRFVARHIARQVGLLLEQVRETRDLVVEHGPGVLQELGFGFLAGLFGALGDAGRVGLVEEVLVDGRHHGNEATFGVLALALHGRIEDVHVGKVFFSHETEISFELRASEHVGRLGRVSEQEHLTHRSVEARALGLPIRGEAVEGIADALCRGAGDFLDEHDVEREVQALGRGLQFVDACLTADERRVEALGDHVDVLVPVERRSRDRTGTRQSGHQQKNENTEECAHETSLWLCACVDETS